jgi:hypothetical protein
LLWRQAPANVLAWGVPVAFGMLVGLTVPGWRGCSGLLIGLVSVAIVVGITGAIVQPDVVNASLLWVILIDAYVAGAWIVGAGLGFAIAVIAHPPPDRDSGDIDAR